MTKHDESLEVGIAAGLDVPTAMVISERGNAEAEPRQPRKKAGSQAVVVAVVVAVIAGAAAMAVAYLLR